MHLFMQHNSSLTNPSATFTKVSTLVLLLLLSGPLPLHAEWSLLDGAKVHPDYHGPVPKKSDVIFSTRFKRDNAAEVARAFGATRIEWVYSTDQAFINSLKQVAPWFGGSLNSSIPLPADNGIARDFDGNPIVAPWAKSWGAKWITAADANAEAVLRAMAKDYISLGAHSIQVDEPLLQYQSAKWGGDFSAASLAKFNEYLSKRVDPDRLRGLGIDKLDNFNYKTFLTSKFGISSARQYSERMDDLPTTPLWLDYLMDSVKTHYAEFRRYVDGMAGKHVPLSMNLLIYGPDEKRPQLELVPYADYAMVETRTEDQDLLAMLSATYRSLGLGWVPSILPRSKSDNRVAIARIYAMGGQPLVPWDVFVSRGSEQKPTRFFGEPDEYADLYRFVRNNAALFDGYEPLAVVGIVVPVHAYRTKETLRLIRRLDKARVQFAFVPVGGTKMKYKPDRERINNLKLLMTANLMSDFADEDLQALRALPIRYQADEAITDHELSDLSPFVCIGCRNVSLYAQANGSQVVLHVIQQEGEAVASLNRECQKTVGFRESRMPLELTYVLPASGGSKANQGRSTIQIDGCHEWSMAVFQ